MFVITLTLKEESVRFFGILSILNLRHIYSKAGCKMWNVNSSPFFKSMGDLEDLIEATIWLKLIPD